jgi:hypothetical protein
MATTVIFHPRSTPPCPRPPPQAPIKAHRVESIPPFAYSTPRHHHLCSAPLLCACSIRCRATTDHNCHLNLCTSPRSVGRLPRPTACARTTAPDQNPSSNTMSEDFVIDQGLLTESSSAASSTSSALAPCTSQSTLVTASTSCQPSGPHSPLVHPHQMESYHR